MPWRAYLEEADRRFRLLIGQQLRKGHPRGKRHLTAVWTLVVEGPTMAE